MSNDEWNVPIDEEWLRASGFRWHQLDRQPSKHWVLWLGGFIAALESKRTGNHWRFMGDEDLGVEVAANTSENGGWFCWLRDDSSHRYHRFIHVRHVWTRLELVRLIEGITGAIWKPNNHRNGCILTDEQIEEYNKREQRLDRALLHTGHPWYESEKDPSLDRPLIEHLEAHILGECASRQQSEGVGDGESTLNSE